MVVFPSLDAARRMFVLLTGMMLVAGTAFGTTFYVAPGGGGDGSDWDEAASSWEDLMDNAWPIPTDGDVVLASNGVYDVGQMTVPGGGMTNRFCITNAITVYAVNGPEATVIEGVSSGGGCGPLAVRGVYLSGGARLIGFTITNGFTWADMGTSDDQSGGGVFVGAGCVLSNCTVVGNMAFRKGGGVFVENGGAVMDCTIRDNIVSNHLGYTSSGGGVFMDGGGTLADSLIHTNYAMSDGGGVFMNGGGAATNCTITRNRTQLHKGGGACLTNGGSMVLCTLSRNVSREQGAGAYIYSGGSMANCLADSNHAEGSGGGIYCAGGGVLNNCTIVENLSDAAAGGVFLDSATMNNCIVWTNSAPGFVDVYQQSSTMHNSCASGIAGDGCISVNPLFVDESIGDYSLQMTSPCIGAGDNVCAPTNLTPYDLSGGPRIAFGVVDMGACERQFLTSTNVGPFAGGNSFSITNSTALGNGADVTNVLVEQSTASITDQGTNWVTINLPSVANAGVKDVIIHSTSAGVTAFDGIYTYRACGHIGETQDWTEIRGMPVAPYNAKSIVFDGALYSIGGVLSGSACTNVYRLDGAGWTDVVGLPMALRNAGCVVYRGRLYVLGGHTGVTGVTNVFCYDGSTWAEVIGMPIANYEMGAAVYDDAIYCVGGGGGGSEKNTVLKFDGSAWIADPVLPSVRTALSTETLDGRLYAIGGYAGGASRTNVWSFDGIAWTEVDGLPYICSAMGTAVREENVYVVGGNGAGVFLTNCCVFDGTDWSMEAGLPQARYAPAVAVLNGQVYSVGGDFDGSGTTNVYVYPGYAGGVAPSAGSWSGGYSVTIVGVHLGGGSDITNVSLCGFDAASIDSQSATQVVVTAAESTEPVTGDVRVYSRGYGETVKSNAFTCEMIRMAVLGTNDAVIASGEAGSPAKGSIFGDVTWGSAKTNIFRITNSGNANLTISGWSTNGPASSAFWVTNIPAIVSVGAISNFNIVFSPSAVGAYSGYVAITNDSTNVLFTLNLAGTGCKKSQTITFGNPGAQDTTNKVGLAATATSALGVTFTVGSGPGSIAGGTNLTFSGPGAVSIVASQAGNGNWNVAPDVTNTFAVTKAVAGVTLNNLSQTYNGSARTVTATTTPNGLTVDISYDNNAWAPTNVGTYTITGLVNEVMYQGGLTDTLTVVKGDQAITFSVLGAQVYTNKLGLDATSGSGLPVSFAVESGPAALAGGTNLSFSATGTVALVLSEAGDANWNAAPSLTNVFAVTGLPPEINNPTSSGVGASTATLGATVTATNNTPVTERGIYWSIVNGFADGSGTKVSEVGSFGAGAFTVNVTGLATGSTNYFKGFASNVEGTRYTAQASFLTKPAAPGPIGVTNITVSGFVATWSVATGSTNYHANVTNSAGYVAGYSNLSVGAVTSLAVTGLVSETPYFVWISARNAVGLSTNSAIMATATESISDISVTPSALTFSSVYSGTNPPPQVLVVTNSGDAAIFTNIFVYTGGSNWLSALPSSGAIAEGGSASVTCSVDTTGLNAGTHLVLQRIIGTAGGNTCTASVSATLTIEKDAQTITFPDPGEQLSSNVVVLSATASSGLPVTFTVESGPGTISGGTELRFSASGTVMVVASQAGDGNWNTAPSVTNSIDVESAAPDAPTGVTASDGTYGNRIEIVWNAVADAASYEVWRSLSSDSASATQVASGLTGTSYDDTSSSVRPRDIYYYWVKSVNSTETSAFSSPDSGYRKPAVNGDYSGNGSTDMAVYDQKTGTWYIRDTQGNIITNAAQWGGPGYRSVPGDYDGDGVNDLAVYDTATGAWYVRTMQGTVMLNGVQYGGPGYAPVPGDYDGDGINDLAVYDQSTGTWYIRTVAGTEILAGVQWGGSSFTPVPGDYDGDGVDDLAMYDQSTGMWYVRTVSGTVLANGIQWGGSGFAVVQGDFDGDGADDLAVYEQSTGKWYVRTLAGTTIVNGDQFGGAGYAALAGDYNGDGTSDLAVYDSATGQWYIQSVTGTPVVNGEQWGGSGYTPSTETDAPAKPAGLTVVYRLFSYGNERSTYEHFFTSCYDEAAYTVGLAWWNYECVAWYALPMQSGESVPLYRAYNLSTFTHYWTTDANAFDTLVSEGWLGEGAVMYVWATASGGRIPVYQFYNAALGKYLFTADENEKATLLGSTAYGYTYQGIMFYVYDSP